MTEGNPCRYCSHDTLRRDRITCRPCMDKFDNNVIMVDKASRPSTPKMFNYIVFNNIDGKVNVVQEGSYFIGDTVLIRVYPPGKYTLRCRAIGYLQFEVMTSITNKPITKINPVWVRDTFYTGSP